MITRAVSLARADFGVGLYLCVLQTLLLVKIEPGNHRIQRRVFLIPAFAGTIRMTGDIALLTVLLNTVCIVDETFRLAQFLIRQVNTLVKCNFEAV